MLYGTGCPAPLPQCGCVVWGRVAFRQQHQQLPCCRLAEAGGAIAQGTCFTAAAAVFATQVCFKDTCFTAVEARAHVLALRCDHTELGRPSGSPASLLVGIQAADVCPLGPGDLAQHLQ